jgi:hypothetical protein
MNLGYTVRGSIRESTQKTTPAGDAVEDGYARTDCLYTSHRETHNAVHLDLPWPWTGRPGPRLSGRAVSELQQRAER